MRKLTTGSGATVLVSGLILAVAVPILGLAPTLAAADAARAKVIVLPLANNTEVGGDELAGRVDRALQLTLAASDRASLISLRLSSPAVRRAIDVEKTLDPGDLDITPPATSAQAERIGSALGADIVLWGSIDQYTYDEAQKQVTIGLSIQKLDLAAEQVSAIALTGKSAAKVGFDAGEGPLMTEAIDDAVSQVVQRVLGVTIVAAPKERAAAPAIGKKKDKTWQTIGALLAAAAVIALASDGGGGAPAVVQPGMVSSATAIPTATAVELSWITAPAASGITSFNIYRAEMGGVSAASRTRRAPQSRVRLTRQASGYSLLANVGRSDRLYTDTSANIGTLYAYRIAAVVGPSESEQVSFYNYYEAQRGAVGVVEVGPSWPTAPAMPSYTPFLQSVALQWTANPEPFIDSYRVYRSASATGPWDSTTLVGEVPADETSFEDSSPGLVAGQTYYYAIGAVTAATSVNGRIGPALQLRFQPGKPAPPSNVRAEPRIGAVILTWDPSPDGTVTGYRVFRNGVRIAQVGSAVTTYDDSPLAAGSYTYAVAAIAGSPVVESDRITAVPAPVSPSSPPSTLTITKPVPPVVANGTSTVDIFATARDSAGAPVQGVEVVFSLTLLGGTIVAHPTYPATDVLIGLSVITDATGKAGVRFRAGTDPNATPVVTASCRGVSGDLSDSVSITLEALYVAAVTLEADPPVLPGDGISTTNIIATVTDQGGGPMAGETVQFVSESPSLGVFDPSDPGQLDRATAVTDDNGRAIVTLRSAAADHFGICHITGTVVGAPAGTPPGEVTVQFVAAPRVTVSLDPRVLPAAGLGSTALITATVKYATGDPVADGTVIRFSFEGGDATSITGARIADGAQRALTQDGIAYSTLISAVDLVNGDSDVIWAWMDMDDDGVWDYPAESLGSAVATYTEAPYRVTLNAEPLSIPADGRSVSKITADVRTNVPDPSGVGYRPVADGTLVEFRTTVGTFAESGTAVMGVRTVGGLAQVFLKADTKSGVATVTGTAALVSGSTQVAFTTPVGVEVSVRAIPTTLQANGTATSQIIAHVKDATTGEPLEGTTVQFVTDLGTLSDMSDQTDANGDATTTFTAGTRSGTATVVATASGASGFTTLTLTSGLAQNVSMTIMAPNVIMPATNGLPSPSGASPTAAVYARVTDKYGNPVVEGTPVFFRTDIGQIDGSAVTSNGLAQAQLVTCNFLDATNKATYRPGWASIYAQASNPSGPQAGPEYQIFCGDIANFNWDGSANDTNMWTGFGADWRTDAIGSFDLAQPHVTPKAGDNIVANLWLADRNNNPLPAGVTVHWRFSIGGTVIAEADDATSLVESYGGIIHCVSSSSATPTQFPDSVTVAYMGIEADAPWIVSGTHGYGIVQMVGAAGPAGTIEIVSDIGNNIQLASNPDGPFTLRATVNDEYGNPVQDGNPVYFEIQDTQNVSETTVNFAPNPAFTVGGIAVTNMTVGVLDETQGGNFTIVAGSPQGGVGADATGTLQISLQAPPQPVRQVLVDYTLAELVGPDPALTPPWYLLPTGGFSFSLENVGETRSTVLIRNILDPADQTTPAQYITFRQHSDSPPASYGDTALTLLLEVGQKVYVDVILNTSGLLTNTAYTSRINVSATDGTVVTYAPATQPQTLRVVVQ